jgi:hypothetical protein
LCPADQDVRARLAGKGEACRMTTRVRVMIPDLPGIGVWMLESHGYYAATELTGVAEMIAAAGQNGVLVPARIRIEQRERRIYRGEGVDPETRKYPVPVLEVLSTMREIAAAAESGQRAVLALPPATAPAKAAIASGRASESTAPPTGQPAEGPSPAQQLADRALCANTDQELRQVWLDAEAQSLFDEWVSVPHYQELISLSHVITERKQDFDGRRTA